MIEDPWKQIDPNIDDGIVHGRRVDAKIPWPIFWAVSSDRKCLLVFRHRTQTELHPRLPKLKSLQLSISQPDQNGISALVVKLINEVHRDLFLQLCLDVVAATSLARNEDEAIKLFLARTWRWHYFLRSGTDRRLTPEEQKGIIGELSVIENVLLPVMKVRDAIAAWTGPTGAPKDFEIGRISIEAKARRGAAIPFIAISSEHQLDTSGVDKLYVSVVEVQGAPGDSPEAFTITTEARRLANLLTQLDHEAADHFERLLMSSGFQWEDDYSDSNWVRGHQQMYEVRDQFPRITPADLRSGVSNLRYSIALKDCEPFQVPNIVIKTVLAEAGYGNLY